MTLYSHSRLGTFEQCPLKFKFHYIDKLETEIEQSVEAFLGSMVHEVLEKLYKDLMHQKLNSLKELIAYFNELWEKNWTEGIMIVRDGYNEENYRKMGEKFITDYYNRFKPFDQDKTIAVEKRIVLEIAEGYKIQGYIDRLSCEGDTYVIHDYKTSGSLMTQDYADKDRQLALYAIAVKELYKDCKKVKLMWHFLAFDKDVVSGRTDSQLEELKGEVVQLIKQIEKEKDFKSRMSALCDWCEFRPLCPNFKHLYELKDKTPEQFKADDGVKIVNEYSKAYAEAKEKEAELEALKQKLVDYAKQKNVDMVYGSDVKAIVKTYPRLSFPKKNDPRQKEFFETIKQIGLWDKLAIADVYELAKMVNKGQVPDELMKLLEEFIEKGETVWVRLSQK